PSSGPGARRSGPRTSDAEHRRRAGIRVPVRPAPEPCGLCSGPAGVGRKGHVGVAHGRGGRPRATPRWCEPLGSGGGVLRSTSARTRRHHPLGPGGTLRTDGAARLKRSLVRVRGRWVEMDPAQVDSVADLMARRDRMRRNQAVRIDVGSDRSMPLPVTDVTADGPVGALLGGKAKAALRPFGTPPGFVGELRPYQDRGAAWLRFMGELGLGAVLADDMGLGKTVQLLALLTDERAEGAAAGPTLLVCPVSLVGNWRREAERFAPGLRVHVQHGTDRPSGNALARLVGACDLVVTTYGVVTRDGEELAALLWHRVVCDEAQALKNHDTRQARAVRSLPASTRIA